MILVDGIASSSVSAHDRGLHYGDGLFETIAVRDGLPRLWERHLARLHEGCDRLGIARPPLDILASEVQRVCEGQPRAVLKIILTRGCGGRGYQSLPGTVPTRIVARLPWPDHPAERTQRGVRVRVCAMRLGSNPALAGIKHLNRLEHVLARNEPSDAAIADGLLLDQAGRVVEGITSNVFFVRGGELHTPDLSDCGVAGVMRGLILDLARQAGMAPHIGRYSLAELLQAEELFLSNSLIGIWPVVHLASRDFAVGPVARRLQAQIAAVSG